MSLLFELRVTIYYLHLSITSWVTEVHYRTLRIGEKKRKRQRPLREALYKRVMKEILSDDKQ